VVASILIIAVSTVLLVYWFRYTCLLLLNTKPEKDFASALAEANKLSFQQVGASHVEHASPADLDKLEKMLERDYRLITYLIEHAAVIRVGGVTLEERLLMLDYHLMRLAWRISRRFSLRRTRAALLEMTRVLHWLANDVGQRIHSAS